MDNTQDPNNPNPTNAAPPNPLPYTTTPGSMPDFTSAPPPPLFNPQPTVPQQDLNPAPTWQPPSAPPISTPDASSSFSTPLPQTPPPWNPPVQQQPVLETGQPTWPPPQPPQPPAPEPVVLPPAVNTTSSPLDNPWGAPAQAPSIDGGEQPVPWQPTPTPQMQEQTPTDLSHLISNAQGEGSNGSEVSQPETLVVPSNGSAEVPSIPTEETRKGIPKWLIGVGVGLLIIVIGATAYFILGIGQSKVTTSIPAQTAQQIKPPAPVATTVPQSSATPATASGSANFGQLGGSSQQQATSAGDLLRKGSQQTPK